MIYSTLKKTLGALCLFIGLFALFTPLTPGAWLIIVGLELMGLGFLIPQSVREKVKDRVARLFRRKTAGEEYKNPRDQEFKNGHKISRK